MRISWLSVPTVSTGCCGLGDGWRWFQGPRQEGPGLRATAGSPPALACGHLLHQFITCAPCWMATASIRSSFSNGNRNSMTPSASARCRGRKNTSPTYSLSARVKIPIDTEPVHTFDKLGQHCQPAHRAGPKSIAFGVCLP